MSELCAPCGRVENDFVVVSISPLSRYGGVSLPELRNSDHIRYALWDERDFPQWQAERNKDCFSE